MNTTMNNNILFRYVEESDLDQVFPLLEQLTEQNYSNRDKKKCWESFNLNTALNSLVGTCNGKIVAYGSIVIENKISSDISGHIEDIIIDKNFRNKNIGIKLINQLVEIGKTKKCYRITLFCKEHLINFYSKNGFKVNNLAMKKYM